jgi:hypothetical protein
MSILYISYKEMFMSERSFPVFVNLMLMAYPHRSKVLNETRFV